MEVILENFSNSPSSLAAIASFALALPRSSRLHYSTLFIKKLVHKIAINHIWTSNSTIPTQFRTISSFLEACKQNPQIPLYIQHIELCIPFYYSSVELYQQLLSIISQCSSLSSITVKFGCCSQYYIQDILSEGFIQTIKDILDQPQASKLQIELPYAYNLSWANPYYSLLLHLLHQRSNINLDSLNLININHIPLDIDYDSWAIWNQVSSLNVKHIFLNENIIDYHSITILQSHLFNLSSIITITIKFSISNTMVIWLQNLLYQTQETIEEVTILYYNDINHSTSSKLLILFFIF